MWHRGTLKCFFRLIDDHCNPHASRRPRAQTRISNEQDEGSITQLSAIERQGEDQQINSKI